MAIDVDESINCPQIRRISQEGGNVRQNRTARTENINARPRSCSGVMVTPSSGRIYAARPDRPRRPQIADHAITRWQILQP